METSCLIRTVAPSDFEQWLPLWDGYNAFYGRSGPTALPLTVTRQTWSRFFDAYEPVHALVAELDGHLVGLTHFIFHRSAISIDPNCYLQDLFTAESARGHGVGRALIQQVARIAAEARCARLYWHTHETNATAMHLYDKLAEKSGFVVYRKSLA
jgi:GNAT superfamily N-acetyltransferase